MRGIILNRTRRYLSWIEDLTTNQGVIGSNPIRRTTQTKGLLREPLFAFEAPALMSAGNKCGPFWATRSSSAGRFLREAFKCAHRVRARPHSMGA